MKHTIEVINRTNALIRINEYPDFVVIRVYSRIFRDRSESNCMIRQTSRRRNPFQLYWRMLEMFTKYIVWITYVASLSLTSILVIQLLKLQQKKVWKMFESLFCFKKKIYRLTKSDLNAYDYIPLKLRISFYLNDPNWHRCCRITLCPKE